MEKPKPSAGSDTHPINREELFDQLERDGVVEKCPVCGVGRVSPKVAAIARSVMPPIDRSADTPRELPNIKGTTK